MLNLVDNIRYALRKISDNPGSSAVAVLAMALGIGLTTTMYSILDGVFLRGLPFEDSEALMHIENTNPSRDWTSLEVTQHDFEEWSRQQTSFESLVGFTMGTINIADGGLPERFNGVWISPEFLDMLRMEPILGRGFTAADAEPGAPKVVLIAHHVWQQRYGGDPNVIGREVIANSEPATLIGVTEEGFRFPAVEELWMPLVLETSQPRGSALSTLEVVGRLRDGVSRDEAWREMGLIASRLEQEFPETNDGLGVVVQPFIDEFIGEETQRVLGIQFAAVLLVLLIACFNVANLLIGRATLRSRELAIRSALGSSRWDAIGRVLTESSILAFGGAALGLALAHVSLRAFDRALTVADPPFWMYFTIGGKTLVATFLFTVLAALVAGIIPAIQASKPQITAILNESSRGSTGSRIGRVSRALVVVQIAFSAALLIGAGLAVRSVLEAYDHDLIFEGERVLTARLGLFEGDHPEEEDLLEFFDELSRRLDAQPGIVHAALGTVIPAETQIGAGMRSYERPDEVYEKSHERPLTRWVAVSPGYFETLGVSLVTGRDFTYADRAGAPKVAIVNEDFARREWPDRGAIGQRIDLWMGEEAEAEDPQAGILEVVGVVPNLRFLGFDNDLDQQGIYVPLAQFPPRFSWVILETAAEDPLSAVIGLRQTVREVDPNLPLYFVGSMEQVLERTLFFPHLLGVLFSVFGVVALALACIGLYGLMAFVVSQRTQEVGVRMALGADRSTVLTMVMGQGLRQVAVGLGFGLVMGWGLSKLMTSVLFAVQAGDLITFTTIPVVLLLVAALACAVPATRASKVDPIEALRHG